MLSDKQVLQLRVAASKFQAKETDTRVACDQSYFGFLKTLTNQKEKWRTPLGTWRTSVSAWDPTAWSQMLAEDIGEAFCDGKIRTWRRKQPSKAARSWTKSHKPEKDGTKKSSWRRHKRGFPNLELSCEVHVNNFKVSKVLWTFFDMTTKWFSSAQVLFQLRLQTNKPAKVKKPKLTGCKQTLNLSTVKDATWAHLIENAGLDVGVGEAREIDRVQRLKVVQRLQGRGKTLWAINYQQL